MIRVHVICEGQTEETFVKDVIGPYFYHKDMTVTPTMIGKTGHKGGYFTFDRLFENLELRLLGDLSSYTTTLFDYYGLPNDFPGKKQVSLNMTIDEKAEFVKSHLVSKLIDKLGPDPLSRFIPYIQMYEFEGLLFSDPQIFADAISQPALESKLSDIRNQFDSPEHINDSPFNAPSKRIIRLYTGYEKVFHGNIAAIDIGIDVLRRECRIFDRWISELEALGQEKRP